jgi:hypothetical protein
MALASCHPSPGMSNWPTEMLKGGLLSGRLMLRLARGGAVVFVARA